MDSIFAKYKSCSDLRDKSKEEIAARIVSDGAASQRKIAEFTSISRTTLQRACRAVEDGRSVGVTGRPKKISDENKENIDVDLKKLIDANKFPLKTKW